MPRALFYPDAATRADSSPKPVVLAGAARGAAAAVGALNTAGLSGLSWNGAPSGRRAVLFSAPPAAYPMTYFWKLFQRNQVTRSPTNARYYTTFFHGNNGDYTWGPGYGNSYYGPHPYPTPAFAGDGKWEISTNSFDYVTRDDGSEPYVINDRWYSQALVVNNAGGNLTHKFYIDLPNVDLASTITVTLPSTTYSAPPSPCIIWGQSPAGASGFDWGGYPDWEEQNAIIRGVQKFTTAGLTLAQIVALGAFEVDSAVLSYCSGQGLTPWYLNMNWTLADISDKSGAGHNPAFVSTNGATPALWTG